MFDRRNNVFGREFFSTDFEHEVGTLRFLVSGWCGFRRFHLAERFSQREAGSLAFGQISFSYRFGLSAHAGEKGRPFGYPDGPSRIKQIERVAAPQQIVQGRNREALFNGFLRLLLKKTVHGAKAADVRLVKCILAVFDLLPFQNFAVGDLFVPAQAPNIAHALEEHCDALKTVGDFNGHRIEVHATCLLEVCKLRYLKAVKPNLPAQAPSAQSGRSPVVFDESYIVLIGVDPDGFQAVKVLFLGIPRVGLEDDLVLGMHLHAVGVLGETAVVGPVAGLHVAHVPGFRAQNTQDCRRVHGAGTDLFAVRLPENAALPGPVFLELEDDLLECRALHCLAFAVAEGKTSVLCVTTK